MEERLTKRAGRNATYRGERILEIIDKLTEIENKQQSCLDVIPPDYQDRITIGTLNGNSQLAKRNNKLFILENAIEAGGLVSAEWHNEQVLQLKQQLDEYANSVCLPVKPNTPLFFIVTEENEDLSFRYGILESDDWIYVIDKNSEITIEDNKYSAKFEYSYDYTFGENVFASKAQADAAMQNIIKQNKE